MEDGGSLRERKKAATRLALHEAALRLAVAHGLDKLTVEAVADEAHVSRRTFSNYFANKEDALLYGDQIRTRQLVAELRDRPRSEAPWQALRESAAAFFGHLGDADPQWIEQLQLIRRHPSVLAQQLASHYALERELAADIAVRAPDGWGDPLRSRVMAATFLATVRTAISVWVEEPSVTTLNDQIARALDRVAEPFA